MSRDCLFKHIQRVRCQQVVVVEQHDIIAACARKRPVRVFRYPAVFRKRQIQHPRVTRFLFHRVTQVLFLRGRVGTDQLPLAV